MASSSWIQKKNPDLLTSSLDPRLFLLDLVDSSLVPTGVFTPEGNAIKCNGGFQALTHRGDGKWNLSEIVAPEQRSALESAISAGKSVHLQVEIFSPASPSGNATAVLYLTRIPACGMLVCELVDIGEQKNLEQKLAHSQKMQAVGQLAGGIAHDFNNLLTAMIGFCDLLLIKHPPGDRSFSDIMQIKQNANRAANLVRQLLAFSRRQTLQPKILDLTDVFSELSNLLRRLLGEKITLHMVHGRDLGKVKADQGQIEQVAINLAVNARDAMKDGGTLTIKTSNIVIEPGYKAAENYISPEPGEKIIPGEYVLVEVTDTGHGIPEEIITKIFEPFFSTKEMGSGTGLGLATVYGIIKQTGGYIFVSSKKDEGTSFVIYLKKCNEQEEARLLPQEPPEKPASHTLTGGETILLVEDEAPVRIFSSRALANKGYKVLEADSAEAAIEIIENCNGRIDLIITDVIMPGMNGPAMVEQISARYPGIKVVFISGYAEDIFISTYGADREFNFLPKPFTLKQLTEKVKETLEVSA